MPLFAPQFSNVRALLHARGSNLRAHESSSTIGYFILHCVQFAVVFEGLLLAPEDGDWAISLFGDNQDDAAMIDDGTRVFIDGQLVASVLLSGAPAVDIACS